MMEPLRSSYSSLGSDTTTPSILPVVAEQLPHPRLVANFDSHASGDLAPLAELSQTAADTPHGMDHQTGFEIVAAIDHHVAIDLPFDAQFAHPMDRRVGLLYQNRGKLLVDPSAGDPLKISIKLFSRVGGKMQLLKHRIVHFRQECANLIGAGKNPTEAGMGITRIATELRLRRFL